MIKGRDVWEDEIKKIETLAYDELPRQKKNGC